MRWEIENQRRVKVVCVNGLLRIGLRLLAQLSHFHTDTHLVGYISLYL